MKYFYLLCLLFACVFVTAQNPIIVKDVTSSILKPQNKNQSYWEYNQWNGKVFYQGGGTGINLCVTDGTTAGTVFLANLYNGSLGGTINYVIPAQDFVYLIITRTISFPPFVTDQQIWKSDGTPGGTVLVSTVNVSGVGFYRGTSKAIIGNTLLFAGSDATNGVELWKTEGTAATTVLLKDIKPGSGNSDPGAFCKIGNDIYFRAYSTGFEGKLWKTDGTAAGTIQIPVAEPFFMVNWDMINLNNKLLFFAHNTVDGYEPYVSDGTAAGTFMLANINPSGNSLPTVAQGLHLKQTDSFCFFIANKGTSTALWRTNGTVAGTIQLTPDAANATNNISDAAYSATDKNNLWFMQYAGASGSSSILYKSNGTVAGTSIIISNSSYGYNLKTHKGALWYNSRDVGSLVNEEPWRSDGLAVNTNRAIDVVPGSGNSKPYGFFELNNKLFFWGDGGASTHNLYQFNSDFTFNGNLAGGRWRDSANWNSRMPPGITDTVFINSGTPNALNINTANAYAGVLTIGNNTNVNLTNVTDSLFVHTKLIVGSNTNITGNGIAVFKNNSNDTVQIANGFTANNVAVQSNSILQSGNATINNNINLTNGKLFLNNNNLVLTGNTSTATANANAYVVTTGTGSLQIQNIGSGARTGAVNFPIGTATNYAPVIFTNSGVADNFNARVQNNISQNYTGETPAGQQYVTGVVNNTWFINEANAGGSNATIELQWDATQELPLFDRTKSYLGHYTGGAWSLGTQGVATGSNPYSFSRSNITNFSPFGILNNNAVLSLQFLSFSAQKCNTNVCLNWQTANEQNVSHFEIERSTDGFVFNKVGIKAANNQQQNSYAYTEDISNVQTKQAYYRIKQVDVNTSSKLSTVQRINLDGKTEIVIYPNPVQDEIKIIGWQKVKAAQLIDISGRVIMQWNVNSSTLPINNIVKGIYMLQLQLKTGETENQKILKE